MSDEIDSARTNGDIETHAGLIALAEEKLKHLDEAMVRLDAGKYGSCLKCAAAISFERLMAIPFASYCVDCQKKLNREEGGWGHAPYDRQWTVPKEIEPSTQRKSFFIAREEPSTIRESEPTGIRLTKTAARNAPGSTIARPDQGCESSRGFSMKVEQLMTREIEVCKAHETLNRAAQIDVGT